MLQSCEKQAVLDTLNPPVDPATKYPGCIRIFDRRSFDGWEADPSTWSIVDGAMRGVGGSSRLAFTKKDYGSFRLIFTARMNPVNGDHLGVLFWGDRPTDASKPKIDNAGWIQFMPPFGGMWDYHPPKHHDLPHETVTQGSRDSSKWCTTELLCNLEKGTVRAAVDGVEIVRYTHPTPGERLDPEKRIVAGPIGMFRHGAGASEYKDIYIEVNPREDKLLTSAAGGSPQIPALHWEERSDWINIKTGATPNAIGDGKADDTVAIQKALDRLRDGSVLYFPPGTYRITAPLQLKNSNGARWIGGLIVGSGRDTKLVWDGDGGPMFLINGVAYSRFVGFELDGRGKAGAGFHYDATQGFQTEVTHQHLAFREFTNAAVLESHSNKGQALAETTFENCLFEDCERGVAFLQFNDYDFTFDGCEFRRCGVAIDCAHGNFYVRNCHFERSRVADIRDLSEHCSSIRRCTSTGSQAFILRTSSVAAVTIQDCHIDSWKNPGGAIVLSRPPVLLFDCVFSDPPRETRKAGLPPVHIQSNGQRLLVSENQVHGAADLVQGARPTLMVIPPGERRGVIGSAGQSFLHEKVRLPGRVFDARRQFGAKGDGRSDDTVAIQTAIDAAAAVSRNAIAYLPTGSYVITSTLRITGKNFSVGGSGWSTKLIWKGPEGGTMIEVKDPQQVTLEDLMVGSHDGGVMNNRIDIEQLGSAHPSRMTYDGVYVYGMYQKAPLRKGLRFTALTDKDVVVMPHVQGNLRFINCSRATVLANCSYEGSVVVEGKDTARDGLLGFQTRLATIVTHGLYLRDNNSIAMSDFYVEQADNGYLFEGTTDAPPGRATITGAKFHSFTSTDPAKNNVIDIRNYHGQIFVGPYQFYQEPKRMRIKQEGTAEVQLFLLGSSWYGASPAPQLSPSAKLFAVGNEAYGASLEAGPGTEQFFTNSPTHAALASISSALDDLRRLGEADLLLNHP